MQFNKEKLNTLIKFYKTSFVEHWKEEKYKWQAAQNLKNRSCLLENTASGRKCSAPCAMVGVAG